ncbi:hypothetical protein R1flu_004890 [Riccia fluitans]|uniref:PhoD-like phosphatase metallophosphatase domain-containing protein n=1 Tax=Riccia fluitans TaxID=41844 RepID=A0ABD1YS45_9MARC
MGDISSEAWINHGKGSSAPMRAWSMHGAKRHAQKKFVSAVERLMNFSRKSSSSNLRSILTHSGQVSVTVGPVIGKVSESTARILLEVGEPGHIVIHLEESEEGQPEESAVVPNGKTVENGNKTPKTGPIVRKFLQAGVPTIFVFDNLKPGTRYIVRMRGCYPLVPSSFKTFPEDDPSSINFAVISCNKIFITEKEIPVHSDLWAHLEKAIRHKKIDMCLHLGDQIYGDGDKMLDAAAGSEPGDWSDCFKKSCSLLSNYTSKDQWVEHYGTICEYYREVYRRTWRHGPTLYCLANCPNLMIYDDHEIRDNWADLEQDWEKESSDFFIALCAWRVYLEYQRQLHVDVDFSDLKAIDKDYHFHLTAGVGIMFLDIRGSRTFHRPEDPEYRYLGSDQWKDIDHALSAGGLFDSAKVLLLCTPAPLVFLDRGFTDVASNVPRLVDFKGHWSAAPHYDEQKRMINTIFRWRAASKDREVLVLGGDVHCGGHSDIVLDRTEVIQQLTTSAIANHPLPKPAYYLLRAAGRITPAAGRNFAFHHHNWTRSRNYGLVHIQFPPQEAKNTRPEVISQLIRGKFMTGIKEGRRVSTYDKESLRTYKTVFCPTGRHCF